jgi:hypothetical protein
VPFVDVTGERNVASRITFGGADLSTLCISTCLPTHVDEIDARRIEGRGDRRRRQQLTPLGMAKIAKSKPQKLHFVMAPVKRLAYRVTSSSVAR